MLKSAFSSAKDTLIFVTYSTETKKNTVVRAFTDFCGKQMKLEITWRAANRGKVM